MAVTLNRPAFDHARTLIKARQFVFDERDDWSEHQPSAKDENRFFEEHGFAEYRKWYLGTKAHYKLPYGDFRKVHRCGLLTAEARAGQYKHFDIELAVAHLHGMLEALH